MTNYFDQTQVVKYEVLKELIASLMGYRSRWILKEKQRDQPNKESIIQWLNEIADYMSMSQDITPDNPQIESLLVSFGEEIKKLRSIEEKKVSSKSKRLSRELEDAIFTNIVWPSLTRDRERGVPQPTAIILGGQPGSGKSTLTSVSKTDLVNQYNSPKSVLIPNGDDFKYFHPEYEALLERQAIDNVEPAAVVGPTSGYWVEQAINKASLEGYNLVIEGTMRNLGPAEKTLNLLNERDYTTEIRVMAVHKERSWLGINQRYEEMMAREEVGRIVSRPFHDAACASLLDTVAQLEQKYLPHKISAYQFGADNFFFEKTQVSEKTWNRTEAIANVVQNERTQQCPYEMARIVLGWRSVMSLQSDPSTTPGRQKQADTLFC